MCGIFGYIGPQDSTKVCLSGLKSLEYRGYDSAGIAGISNQALVACKEEGRVAVLEKTLTKRPLKLDLAIAHTRWATHGKPSRDNAHPHFDSEKKIAVVHNGIIENHFELKERLQKEGTLFSSDTDTEVISHLVSHFYKGDLLSAVQQALTLLRGFWAICLIHKDHPGTIIAAAKENPLCIGKNCLRKEVFVSSDPQAFQGKDLDVIFLKSGEVACIKTDKIDVFNPDSAQVEKPVEHLFLSKQKISKGGFAHFMLKEIMEQPKTLQQALHNRMIEGYGTAEFENLSFSSKELLGINRILILACGTSFHAGCIAASLFEEMARIPTQAEIASEFRYKNPLISENTLVIAISQSGETLDTLAAMREVKRKGAKVLGICNAPHSTLTREADSTLLLRAGPEISVCSTKAFTSQLAVLSLFALMMARLKHLSKEEGKNFLYELAALPQVVQEVLNQRGEIQRLAKKYSTFNHFFFLGRHYMFATSLEAALKLKEISYLFASGYPSGEMKHGPIALIDSQLAVIGMCGNKRTYEKSISNLLETKARGATILAFVPKDAPQIKEIAQDVLYLPATRDELAPIPYTVATQLFAYEIAALLGREIDKPRNLAKSVTVE
ncbi:MAG: glutamine--fructose-6-phosphate aminotransferase [Chlamydiae bacterium RIFCSPHIGHO2_12_FULL_49_32]|nr:MAG: glutamine--fructose-6-phosphate aminotransferase [Chlamydiae bacterium RIFCSPHIGHO2_12_FULL_49_32]